VSTTTNKYNLSGALLQSRVVHANGSCDIYDYHVTGASCVSDHRVYDAAGTLTHFVGIGAHGATLVDNYVVSSKPYSSDQLTFNASGILTTPIYHNQDGSTTSYEYISNGSLSPRAVSCMRTVPGMSATLGSPGQSYVADNRVYDAVGKLTEYVAIASNGSEKATAYAAGVKFAGGIGNDAFYRRVATFHRNRSSPIHYPDPTVKSGSARSRRSSGLAIRGQSSVDLDPVAASRTLGEPSLLVPHGIRLALSCVCCRPRCL
jgi:hypothetical protein